VSGGRARRAAPRARWSPGPAAVVALTEAVRPVHARIESAYLAHGGAIQASIAGAGAAVGVVHQIGWQGKIGWKGVTPAVRLDATASAERGVAVRLARVA